METYRVHFEINEFTTRQSDDNLALIDGTFHDCFLVGSFPLVDSSVSTNVANAIRVHLNEGIVP